MSEGGAQAGRRIREATPADAESASAVLIASISALCAADHGGDPSVIAAWTQNKTPDAVQRWIEGPVTVLVLEVGEEIAAVGACSEDRILLNYVAPTHRGRGHSKALLAEMERRMRACGSKTATLTSTMTALRLYESAGWRANGPVETAYGFPGQPMTKDLSPLPAGDASP